MIKLLASITILWLCKKISRFRKYILKYLGIKAIIYLT